MTPLQSVSIVFGLLLLALLAYTFLAKESLTDDQRTLLRFFCAVCAGFVGGLMTGDALFKADSGAAAGIKWTVSGTAGFALFFSVWFTFPKVVRPPDAFHFTVPDGWTFAQTVDGIAKADNAVASCLGFGDAEMAATLRNRELRTKTVTEAFRALRFLTSTPIREYDVTFEAPAYVLRVKADMAARA